MFSLFFRCQDDMDSLAGRFFLMVGNLKCQDEQAQNCIVVFYCYK